MLRSRLPSAALLAVAMQLALSLPTSLGLVLCVGTNGHVAVERGGCGDETPAALGDCREFGASTPCTDTPLASGELPSGSQLRTDSCDAGLAHAAAFLTPTPPTLALGELRGAAAGLGGIDRPRHGVLRL